MIERELKRVLPARPTLEGAGVRLHRAFGYPELPEFDPFLLLDDFGSEDPDDYTAGFPWHPHRGIETVTYMLDGTVEHGDSIGNQGTIGPGDIQWMTAGSGIIHQEMPQAQPRRLRGFQLWVNLPAARKMMDPRYRDVRAADVPAAVLGPGAGAKVICGRVGETVGPVRDVVVDVEYLDVTLEPGAGFERDYPRGHRVFAYCHGGSLNVPARAEPVGAGRLLLFGEAGAVRVTAGREGARLLLAAGRPLGEPVAWRGPIVMNTGAELDRAFGELRDGTFVRSGRAPGSGR
jgi:hypothetical protein